MKFPITLITVEWYFDFTKHVEEFHKELGTQTIRSF